MLVRVLSILLAATVPFVVTGADLTGKAVLKNADGKQVGTATFTPAKGGVKVHVQVADLPPGKHGIHIHAVGQCEPPDFKSAGGHFNPFGKQHGLHNPKGAHVGDLLNFVVGHNGKANTTFMAKGATLSEDQGSLFGPEGTSLVIHADRDDEKTDPAGNSGIRIVCGVIEKE